MTTIARDWRETRLARLRNPCRRRGGGAEVDPRAVGQRVVALGDDGLAAFQARGDLNVLGRADADRHPGLVRDAGASTTITVPVFSLGASSETAEAGTTTASGVCLVATTT